MKSKNMVSKWMIPITLSLMSATAFAGQETGNGGVSVVCRDLKGNVIGRPEMLDIFEGKNQYKLIYQNTPGLEVETMVDLTQLRMTSNQKFTLDFQNELSRVRSKITFLNRGVGLEPTNDAFPVINKKGCSFEQVANYAADGNIYVDKEIFDRLDKVNQAALYVHETVYSIARNNVGDTSSIRSRRLTAQVLAKNPDSGVVRELMEQLVTPPTPVEPPSVDWTLTLREGLYFTDRDNDCGVRIDRSVSGWVFATYTIGRNGRECAAENPTFEIYFPPNSKFTDESSDYCNRQLAAVEILGPNSFVGTARKLDSTGKKCISGSVERKKIYRHL